MTETAATYQAGHPPKRWRCDKCGHILGDVELVNGREEMTLVDKLMATAAGRVVAFQCPNCKSCCIWCRNAKIGA